MLSAADTAVELEICSTDMNLSLTLFMCRGLRLYMKGFSCIQDSENTSLKRKLLTAVQKGMCMAKNTSDLMLILVEKPKYTYFFK
jgi:hypothetical protein